MIHSCVYICMYVFILLHVLPVLLQIRDELPHLKAIIQYIGNPPTGEGVYEVSHSPFVISIHTITLKLHVDSTNLV